MTEELKPCPFCGGNAHAKFHQLEETWSIRCYACAAVMPYVGLSEAEAIAAWNTRPADRIEALEAEVAQLRSLVKRARALIPARCLDWREDARQCLTAALGAKP